MALAEETGLINAPHFGAFLDGIIARFRAAPAQDADDHSCREFVTDKIWDNADAFASEYDVQAMMSHFPGDF